MLRPQETRRLWPLLIPALIVIKVVLPGTLGAIKQSFLPPGGLVAEQQSKPGEAAAGGSQISARRLEQWSEKPLFGAGFRTRVIKPGAVDPWPTSSTTSGSER